MRMWNVDPSLMCNQHLLGEHVEMHMFEGSIRKGKSIQGYIDNGLLETHNLLWRHDRLAEEMIKRGMNHKSPLYLMPSFYFDNPIQGKIDVNKSLRELKERCQDCAKKINNSQTN